MARLPFWELKQNTAEERLAKQAECVDKAAQIPDILDRAPDPTIPKAAPAQAKRSNSYSDLLSRLYQQFDELADELASSAIAPDKKAEALSKLARTLPLLRAAQDANTTKVNKKELKQLTDEELKALVTRELK